MTFPAFTAGQRLTAASLQSVLNLHRYVEKTVTQNSTTTSFADDNELFMSVEANATYTFECLVLGSCAVNNTSHLKLTFSSPAGSEVMGTVQGPNNLSLTTGSRADGEYVARFALSDASSIPVGVSTSACGIILSGRISVASTAGTMRLRWAQLNASADATTISARSYLRLHRVA